MGFFCVLSVGGSLAYYHVQKESDEAYKAVLQTHNGHSEGLPAEIIFTKKNDNWQAQPWHDEVVKSLVQAIEAKSQ